MEPALQATILFADVSGSARLYEMAGDAIAAAAIDQCITMLKEKTEAAGGRVIKTIGDEIMSVFHSADAAANAAMAMQAGAAQLPLTAGMQLGIRIGFNCGPVVERNDDVFGDAVNVAARLTSQAQKGQIITSQEAVEALSPTLKASCRQLYSIQIKGKEQEVELCEVMWHGDKDATTQVVPIQRRLQPRKVLLRLRYGAQEIILNSARGSLSLGRDQSAEMVINDVRASRAHCRIERRMDKYILTDHSANGTYITVEGDEEVVLKREEFTLRAHGWIAFGGSRADAVEMIEFFCEG